MKVVDELMDSVASEQHKRLETIDDELEDVKRKLGRIWYFIEMTDIDMADASDRIKEHRERQHRLEASAAEGEGDSLPAQGSPGRRGDDCGLRLGHERVSER